MKKMTKFLLTAVVGIVCSLVILFISGTIHMYLSAGLAAGGIAGILNYKLAKSDIKLVIIVVVFIVAYILYTLLYQYVNYNSDINIFSLLVFFAPYILGSYVFFETRSSENKEENKESIDTNESSNAENNDKNQDVM